MTSSIMENTSVLIKENETYKSVEEPSVGVTEPIPYRAYDTFLSESEQSFFRALLLALDPGRYHVFTKVSLNELFWSPKIKKSDGIEYSINIINDHVDFLICDAQTFKPVCGIEIDDPTRDDVKDAFKISFINHVYLSSNLTLYRMPAKSSYEATDIIEMIEGEKYKVIDDDSYRSSILSSITDHHTGIIDTVSSNGSVKRHKQKRDYDSAVEQGICSKCQSSMKQRAVLKGKFKGRTFWQCTNYPACTNIVYE